MCVMQKTPGVSLEFFPIYRCSNWELEKESIEFVDFVQYVIFSSKQKKNMVKFMVADMLKLQRKVGG